MNRRKIEAVEAIAMAFLTLIPAMTLIVAGVYVVVNGDFKGIWLVLIGTLILPSLKYDGTKEPNELLKRAAKYIRELTAVFNVSREDDPDGYALLDELDEYLGDYNE